MNSDPVGQATYTEKRIDFHTHILPNMDDGSSSVEMSVQMVRSLSEQGVRCIVLTPHFYPTRDNPEHFFEKRKEKLDLLRSELGNDAPVILAGAEIHFFEGITEMQDLPKLRIEGSLGLMIEMPMCTWSERMISSVFELSRRREYQVILAHAERYIPLGNLPSIKWLASSGVMMQISSDAFSGMFRSRKALKLLDEGLVQILGSDCHNMTTRPPDLGQAYDMIRKKRGEEAIMYITDNGLSLFSEDIRKKL